MGDWCCKWETFSLRPRFRRARCPRGEVALAGKVPLPWGPSRQVEVGLSGKVPCPWFLIPGWERCIPPDTRTEEASEELLGDTGGLGLGHGGGRQSGSSLVVLGVERSPLCEGRGWEVRDPSRAVEPAGQPCCPSACEEHPVCVLAHQGSGA